MSFLDIAGELQQRDQVWSFMASQQVIDVSHQVILYVEDLSVNFDGFKALNNLNLYINDGELRCLTLGSNGQ